MKRRVPQGQAGALIRRLSTRHWIIVLSVAVVSLLAPVNCLVGGRQIHSSLRAAVSLGLAYALVELVLIRLRIDQAVTIGFVIAEVPLLFGVVAVAPLHHVAARFIAVGIGNLIRRRAKRNQRRLLVAFMNACWSASSLTVFLTILHVFRWQGSIRWMGWLTVGFAWLGFNAADHVLPMAARWIAGEPVRLADERQQVGIMMVFSGIALTIGAILVAASERDPFVVVYVSFLLSAVVIPIRWFTKMWQRWSESSDLYSFADLLTHSTSTELEPVLRQAARATKTATAELVLLERAGVDASTDAVLHASFEDHRTRRFDELPESWRQVLRTGTARVRLDRSSMGPEEQPLSRNEVVSALLVGHQPIGLLICSDQLDPTKTIETRDVEVAGILARHLGMWLEQDRLVAELRNEIQERTQQALHDPLTGLPNRRRFNEAMHEQLAGGEPFAIFVIDLDGFKGVNDLIGHESGDLILNRVAERLQRVMPKRAIVARLGGDEFAVLLPGTRGALDADHLGRQIREELSIPHSFEEKSFEVEGSVGIAMYPEHGTELAELLRNADAAMYAAKHSEGGPGVVVYGDRRAYVTSPAHRLIDAVKLKSAIEDRKIVAWYQPIVSLADCRVVGFEALARWEDNGKIITPDKFITLAEDTRVINQITELVMSSAFTDAMRWRTRFGRDFGMSVNLSPAGLADPHLATYLLDCLEATGLPPSAVTLEVTESRVMRDPQRSIALLERMKSLGVRLALDDFGTGQSSLQWLKKLPVDTLKIDRSFIMDLGLDPRSDGITEVTVLLGTKLGMNITAEGIETALQWNTVRDLGVDKAQGYLFAKPMPRGKVDEWLEVEEPYLAHTLALIGSLGSMGSTGH